MFDTTQILIDNFVDRICEGYSRTYGGWKSDYADIIGWAGGMALENIANSDALYHNVDYMKGAPEGLPFSDIDIFKQWNWTPSAESMKERSWNTGLNYFQYYNMTQLHYASLRTVYRYDTSVLTIDDFSNALIYTKHEIRQSWAVFAGVTLPAGVLRSQITNDLTLRLDRLYNNRYTFTVVVYQTEEEALLGYVHHVRVVITSPANNRVWEVDLVCQRENFEG